MGTTRLLAALAASAALAARAAEEGLTGDSVPWNDGVDCYLAGDATNALRLLRPIVGSPTHGARAAELVARMEFDAAAADETNRLDRLQAAASAAQTALRANPDDRRARDNFTRATQDIASLREERHEAKVVSAAKGRPPAELMKAAVADARSLMGDERKLAEMSPVERVAASDKLAERAGRLADAWLPLKAAIEEAGAAASDSDSAEAFLDAIGRAREDALQTARLIGDMKPAAEGLERGEQSMTDAYRGVLASMGDLSGLMGEGVASQSNVVAGVESVGRRGWQADALAWTKAFRAAFEAQGAEAGGQPVAAAAGQPAAQGQSAMTPEARREIAELAEKLEKLQYESCLDPSEEKARESLDAAVRILELLAPPEQQQQQQDQQEQQNQQNQQQDQQQQNQQQNQQQQKQDRQDNSEESEGEESEEGEDEKEGESESEGQPEDEEEEKEGEAGESEEEEGEDEKDAAAESEEKEDAEEEERAMTPEEKERAADEARLMRVLTRSEGHENDRRRREGRGRRSSREIGW